MSNLILAEKAEEFTSELNNVFHKIWNSNPFQFFEAKKGYAVESPRQRLTKGSEDTILSGDFTYRLALDRSEAYLSVQASKFRFYLDDDSEPLFRFEFDKRNINLPRAHFHIHLDPTDPIRNKLSSVIKRRNSILSSVHFPLGGNFLRPCLEDVLVACENDLGIGLTADDRSLLLNQIAKYRKTQAKAAYREHLEDEFGKLEDSRIEKKI